MQVRLNWFAAFVPLALVACSSKPKPPAPESDARTTAVTVQGVPGGVVVQTFTMTANVTLMDRPARELMLLTPDGKKRLVKCGPEIVNYDQIRVGDQLNVTVAEELAVFMAPEAAPAGAGGGALVALAPQGAKPAGIMAATVEVVATVTAIDVPRRKATLAFPDGTTRAVAVRADVDLAQRKVGERVIIRVTKAMALSVEKP